MNHVDLMTIKARQKGTPLFITLVDGIRVVDGLPGNSIVLDQDAEMGHAFRNSNTPYVDDSNRYELISFKYSAIANVKTNLSKQEMIDILDLLETDGVIVSDNKQDILDSVIIKN